MSDQIIKYKNYFPAIGKNNIISKKAWIIGNVIIMDNVMIYDSVVIRGDGDKIEIGEGSVIKENSTVHVASDFMGTVIKKNCLIGKNVVIHACILEDNVITGDNCVIMDGAEIGRNCFIKNNSLISPGKKIPAFSLVEGIPGKVVRKFTAIEYIKFKNNFTKNNKDNNSLEINRSSVHTKKNILQKAKGTFIATDLLNTANFFLHENASIWFSVRFYGVRGRGEIDIGSGTNIQDNTVINTKGQKIVIGDRVTIGHNVTILGPIQVEDGAVIGMGATIEEGVKVERNAIVGANSFVKKNTIVTGHTIFAGSPAILFRKVKNAEKKYFDSGQKVYERLATQYNK